MADEVQPTTGVLCADGGAPDLRCGKAGELDGSALESGLSESSYRLIVGLACRISHLTKFLSNLCG